MNQRVRELARILLGIMSFLATVSDYQARPEDLDDKKADDPFGWLDVAEPTHLIIERKDGQPILYSILVYPVGTVVPKKAVRKDAEQFFGRSKNGTRKTKRHFFVVSRYDTTGQSIDPNLSEEERTSVIKNWTSKAELFVITSPGSLIPPTLDTWTFSNPEGTADILKEFDAGLSNTIWKLYEEFISPPASAPQERKAPNETQPVAPTVTTVGARNFIGTQIHKAANMAIHWHIEARSPRGVDEGSSVVPRGIEPLFAP